MTSYRRTGNSFRSLTERILQMRPTILSLAVLTALAACTEMTSTEAQQHATARLNVTAAPLVIDEVYGYPSNGGTFEGTVSITQFSRSAVGDTIYVAGTLTGEASSNGVVTQVNETLSAMVVRFFLVTANCSVMTFHFLSPVPISGSTVSVTLTATRTPVEPRGLARDLCALAGEVNVAGNPPLDKLDRELAAVNAWLQ